MPEISTLSPAQSQKLRLGTPAYPRPRSALREPLCRIDAYRKNHGPVTHLVPHAMFTDELVRLWTDPAVTEVRFVLP